MFFMLSKGVLLQALLALPLVDSARMMRKLQAKASLLPGEDIVRVKKIPKDNICGGPGIRQMLTADSSVNGIRNAPWQKIMAVAEAYLQDQATRIAQLQQEAERLQAAVLKAEQEEAKKPLTKQQIQETITAALQASGSFGSVQNAVASKCGAEPPRVRRSLTPPVKASAFKTCVKAFEVEASELFKSNARADGQGLRKECDAMLPGGIAGEQVSYCAELCQKFADIAVTKSAGAYAGGASAQLRTQLETTRVEWQAAMHQQSECKDAKEVLAGFRLQLAGCQDQIKVEFEKVQDARDSLGDAEDNLLDLEDEIEAQSSEVESASKIMDNKGKASQAAKTAFEKLVASEFALKVSLKKTRNQLSTAKTELDDAMKASSSVQEVKAMVSQTMLNMALYFKEAVVEPIRDMGLDTDTVVEQYFLADPTQSETASAFKESVRGLGEYCEKTAIPAFRTVFTNKEDLKADVNKLCEFGGVDDAVDGVDAAVAHTIASVKEELEAVQGWLDPYHGSMTREIASKLVSEGGEPVGLHEIMSVFGKTSYYRQYLARWKKNARGVGFLKLIAELDEIVGKLHEQKVQVTEALKDLMLKVADMHDRRVAASKSMKEAIEAHEVAEEQHAEAVALLTKQEEDARKAEDQIDGLRKLLEEAMKRYEIAQTELESTFRKGTSMLQQLEEFEDTSDEPTEAHGDKISARGLRHAQLHKA